MAALAALNHDGTVKSNDSRPKVMSQRDVQPTDATATGEGPNSAFIEGFRVLCRGKNPDSGTDCPTYEVCNAACSFLPNALADTGAGPSIISQGILDRLPSNAAIQRMKGPTKSVEVVDVQGGQLLLTHMVRITFLLNGLGYEHAFRVLEGGDLVILGNDFLRSHGAIISLGDDCRLQLPHCNLPKGKLHTVKLRTASADETGKSNHPSETVGSAT